MTTGESVELLVTVFGGFVQLQLAGLFVTGLLVIPVSFVTLWVYRRRLVRSLESSEISAQAIEAATRDPEPLAHEDARSTAQPPARPEQELVGVRRQLPHDLGGEARRHLRNLAQVYSFAGLALALAFAAGHGPVSGFRFWSVFMLCCVAAGLNLLVLYGRWRPGPWGVGLLIVSMFVFDDHRLAPVAALLLSVMLLALLLHPRLRAMAPMAMAFFGLVTTGTFAAIAATTYLYRGSIIANVLADPRLVQFVEKVTSGNSAPSRGDLWAAVLSTPEGEFGAFFKDHLASVIRTIAGLSILGLVVSLLLGGLVVTMVARSYSRKGTSAQWLVVVSSWVVVAIASCNPERPLSMVTNLASVAIVAVAVRVMWRRQRRTEQPGVRMLLLRSFMLGKRSDRFFQELEVFWRGVGSIQLIGGPDLALSTLEPHELLDFFRGRANRYFVHRPADVEARIGAFDYERDPDGCFRVNDLYCVDAVWQYAVTRLLNSSDCVLMDLRGFNRHRAGCVLEIKHLAQSMAPSRVVFLVDRVTDRGFVEETWIRGTPPDSAGEHQGGADLLFVADGPRARDVCGRVAASLSGPSASPSQTALAPSL